MHHKHTTAHSNIIVIAKSWMNADLYIKGHTMKLGQRCEFKAVEGIEIIN